MQRKEDPEKVGQKFCKSWGWMEWLAGNCLKFGKILKKTQTLSRTKLILGSQSLEKPQILFRQYLAPGEAHGGPELTCSVWLERHRKGTWSSR